MLLYFRQRAGRCFPSWRSIDRDVKFMELLHGLGKLDDTFETFDCINKKPDLRPVTKPVAYTYA